MWAQVSRAFIRPAIVRSEILRRKDLSFEIGFFDGVHVRTVGRQISQLGSRRLDELLDPWPLVARQIVHDDDVAFRECRNEHLSTHSSKVAPFIGLSKAFWATRPERRRPATSVTVL